MALGNANTSAQARGKAKPVIVKRRKEVVMAKRTTTSIVATGLTGAVNGASACSAGGSMNFDKEYYVNNITNGIPDEGAKVYSRPRINDKYLLEEGLYLFKIPGVVANWVMTINSSNVVEARTVCR